MLLIHTFLNWNVICAGCGEIILSVSRVNPRLCSEFSTATMWFVFLCVFEFVGFLRGQPVTARTLAKS